MQLALLQRGLRVARNRAAQLLPDVLARLVERHSRITRVDAHEAQAQLYPSRVTGHEFDDVVHSALRAIDARRIPGREGIRELNERLGEDRGDARHDALGTVIDGSGQIDVRPGVQLEVGGHGRAECRDAVKRLAAQLGAHDVWKFRDLGEERRVDGYAGPCGEEVDVDLETVGDGQLLPSYSIYLCQPSE